MIYNYEAIFETFITTEENDAEPDTIDAMYWGAQTQRTLIGLRSSNSGFPTSIKFTPGELAFIVWAEWSTGDSFGWDYRCSCDIFGIFKNQLDASIVADLLKVADGEFTCELSGGKLFTVKGIPWGDYFERLEEVHITEVPLQSTDNIH